VHSTHIIPFQRLVASSSTFDTTKYLKMNEFMGFGSFLTDCETSPAEEIRQTKDRCDLILECKHQIEYWRSKLDVLEDEQATYIKLARLRMDAPSTWRSLSRRERMEKRFILAALESPELPSALSEFPSSAFPAHIRLDRDILLARVKRPDFGKDRSLFRQPEESEESCAMDRYFFVPPRLRNDKEVILAILRQYPQVIECMSSDLRDDEDILKQLLSKHPGSTFPDNFMQHFSDRIRCSASIVLEVVAQHPFGLSALGFCGHELRNNKEFILKAIEKAHHSSESETQVLRYASHRLRADEDIVCQAVTQSGLNLKHASYQLRREKVIVIKASMQNGGAFRYCLPGTAKDDLFHDREFLLHVVSFSPNYVLKNCSPECQNDRELLLKAAINGLDWDLVPNHLQDDRHFLVDMIWQAPHRYLELPESIKEIFEVAFAVFQAENASDDEMLEATEQCPQLLSNREAMWIIANKADNDIISETLQFSSLEIRGDKELMLRAIEKADPVAFEYCTEDLQLDIDVVMAALPSSLYLVSNTYQYENPEVVKMAIEKLDRSDLWVTHDDIFEGAWNNREIAQAWLAKGGDWLHEEFPEEFENDEELWLTVAANNWSEFEFASDSLKNNKAFMLKLLDIDGRIIREAEVLREDYDVVLAAFSKDVRAIQFYSGGEDFEFICGFAKWTRQKIEECKAFKNEFVTNISKSSTRQDSKCPLGMLNQGPELLTFYTEEISSFLGLPDPERFQMLEAASNNLLSWGL
jgi:hypothetical protein